MGLGSGIRKKPIPDPGSRSKGQKGTGSRIRNTTILFGHHGCVEYSIPVPNSFERCTLTLQRYHLSKTATKMTVSEWDRYRNCIAKCEIIPKMSHRASHCSGSAWQWDGCVTADTAFHFYAELDPSSSFGFGSVFGPSSKWCESATTGLSTLHSSIVSIHTYIVSIQTT